MSFDISQLPAVSWRDLPKIPCETADYDFSHSNAERRWPFIDGAGHDHAGRDSIPVRCTFYFLNTMLDGVLYYTEYWQEWREALFDGVHGPLQHPDLGTFDAVVQSGSVRMNAQTRSGVIVSVNFVEHVEDPEKESQFSVATVDIEAAAKAADSAMADAGLNYPDGMPESDFLSSYQAIKGDIFSATLRVTGAINQIQGLVVMVIDDLKASTDPENWPHMVIMVSFWNALQDTKKRIEQKTERAVGQHTTRSEVSLSSLANQLNNTVDQLIELNLSLVSKPYVPALTVVRYYR